jgi:murein DD-endopeptidase MepM/ murein hydrolase activator NlpD
MSLREAYPKPQLPNSHYFFSLARGERIRTFALRPAMLWALIGLVPLLGLWSAGTTLFIAFHDDMLSALVARQAEMQNAYEDRLADARSQLDRVTSRQLLDQTSFEGKMHELLSRQALLEQRGSIVAALVSRETTASIAERGHSRPVLTRAPSNALTAIGAASPAGGGPSDSVLDSTKAFAPLDAPAGLIPRAPKPRPVDEPTAAAGQHDRTSMLTRSIGDAQAIDDVSAAAENPDVAAPTRLNLIAYSLDQMEKRQMKALGQVGAVAERGAARLRAVFASAGFEADKLTPPSGAASAQGGVGGPYIPLKIDPDAPAFDKAVTSAERALVAEDRLLRVMPFMPLRRPLIGEANVTSPFGYRNDPFLGRPALHPGVDLVQEYGAGILATGAGKVIHAGPMGGYGNMVEIDHGNGLTTRYGHMSAVLVEEGQEVKAGDELGRIGSTGRSTGPHLHYEVRQDGEPVDPTRFLRAGEGLMASE